MLSILLKTQLGEKTINITQEGGLVSGKSYRIQPKQGFTTAHFQESAGEPTDISSAYQLSASSVKPYFDYIQSDGDLWVTFNSEDQSLSVNEFFFNSGGDSLKKATGAQVTTGTDDTAYVTSKAIADSDVLKEGTISQITFPVGDLKTQAPVNDTDAANKKYVDDKANTKLNLTDFNTFRLMSLSPIIDYSSREHSILYWDVRDPVNGKNVDFNSSSGAVTKVIDQSYLKDDTTSVSGVTLAAPADLQNHRNYLKFNSGKCVLQSAINLDTVTVTALFKPTNFATQGGSQLENGIFGNDNGGWDKFLAFRNNTNAKKILMVGGASISSSGTRGFAGVGDTGLNYQYGIRQGGFLPKADPSVPNQIHAITVVYRPRSQGKTSEIWCNGKKLGSFISSAIGGSSTSAVGDINPASDVAKFSGSLYFLNAFDSGASAYINDTYVKLLHQYLAQQYDITTWDPIT